MISSTQSDHDPATELNTLYELSDGGKAGWWPKCLARFGYPDGAVRWDYFAYEIDPQHALDLARAEAERRLVEKGYWRFRDQYIGVGVIFDTLAEALKHAVTNPPTSQTSAEG